MYRVMRCHIFLTVNCVQKYLEVLALICAEM